MRGRDRVQQPREDPLWRRRAPGLRPQLQRQAHERRSQPGGPRAQPPQPSAHRRLGHPPAALRSAGASGGRPIASAVPIALAGPSAPPPRTPAATRATPGRSRSDSAAPRNANTRAPPTHQPRIGAPSRQPSVAAWAALTGQPRTHAPAQHLLDQISLDDYDQQGRKQRGPSRSPKKAGGLLPFWRTSSRPSAETIAPAATARAPANGNRPLRAPARARAKTVQNPRCGRLHWPRRGRLKWPHFASVVVGVDVA